MSKWIKANSWAKTYAVYKNLKRNYMQASWKSWHQNDQKKSPDDIESLWKTKAFQKEHYFYIWCQVIANQQFEDAVNEVKKMGILIKGDMPILMNEEGTDEKCPKCGNSPCTCDGKKEDDKSDDRKKEKGNISKC